MTFFRNTNSCNFSQCRGTSLYEPLDFCEIIYVNGEMERHRQHKERHTERETYTHRQRERMREREREREREKSKEGQ